MPSPADPPSIRRADLPRLLLLGLGVWLHAADNLVAATIMPSAVREIGGLPYIYWTIGLYELGSILAGALAGLFTLRFGLARAMAVMAACYGAGCLASPLAPDMAIMLAGRLLQGFGGGGMVALSYVGVSVAFPKSLWPKLYALISAVWGVSALTGPMIGGLFAAIGHWRLAFLFFAVQALALAVLASRLRPAGGGQAEGGAGNTRPPWLALGTLAAVILAASFAGVQQNPLGGMALALLAALLFRLFLSLEARASERLLPPHILDPSKAWGPGFLMVFTLAAATISFTVYAPLLLQELEGVSPFVAGLLIVGESIAWSGTALLVAGAGEARERTLIRGGAVSIAAGVAWLAVAMPTGAVFWILPGALLQGGGFGLCWAFLARRLVGAMPPGEEARGAGAVPTLQLIGYALGAAMGGIIANGTGLAEQAPRAVVASAAFWLFAAFLPLTAVGIWGAFRTTAARS